MPCRNFYIIASLEQDSLPYEPWWRGSKLPPEAPESRFSLFFFPAFQSTCCLSQPWTKHITAPEQHGILSYLPAASTVLTSDTSVLSCAGVCQCTVAHAAGLAAALREPGVGHANVLYNHIYTTSSSRVPPVVTDWGGSFQVVPKFGVRLEMKVLAQLCCGFATSIVYLTWFRLTKHSCQWQSVAVEAVKCARASICPRVWWLKV